MRWGQIDFRSLEDFRNLIKLKKGLHLRSGVLLNPQFSCWLVHFDSFRTCGGVQQYIEAYQPPPPPPPPPPPEEPPPPLPELDPGADEEEDIALDSDDPRLAENPEAPILFQSVPAYQRGE